MSGAIFYQVGDKAINVNTVTAIERAPATSSKSEQVMVSFVGGSPVLLDTEYEGFMKRFGSFLERANR